MRIFKGLFIAALVAAVYGTAPAAAQTAVSDSAPSAPSFLSYGKVASGYMFGDQRYVVSPNWVAQGGTTASWANGVYADLWLSQDANDRSFSKGRASEIDVTAGWSGSCGALTCHVQAAYYSEPTLLSFKSDIVRLRAEIKRDYTLDDGWSVGWYAGNDYFAFLNGPDTDVLRGGVTATKSFGKWTFSGRAGYGYDIRPHNSNANWEADVSRDVGNGWSVGPYAEGFVPLNHGSKTFAVWGVKFSKAW